MSINYLTANNSYINFYLDSFERRIKNRERLKVNLISNSFKILYLLLIIRYSLSLFIEFSYEMKLYSFDLSLFYGGIYKYNNLFIFLSLIFGMSFNLKFRCSNHQDNLVWLDILNFIRGKNRMTENLLNISKMNDQNLSLDI